MIGAEAPGSVTLTGVIDTYASAGRLPGAKVRVAGPELTEPPSAAVISTDPAGGLGPLPGTAAGSVGAESRLVSETAPSLCDVPEVVPVGSVPDVPPEDVPVPPELSVPEEMLGVVPPVAPAVTPLVLELESLSTGVALVVVSLVVRDGEVGSVALVGADRNVPPVESTVLSVASEVVAGEVTVMLGTSTGGGGGGETISVGVGTAMTVVTDGESLPEVVDEPEEMVASEGLAEVVVVTAGAEAVGAVVGSLAVGAAVVVVGVGAGAVDDGVDVVSVDVVDVGVVAVAVVVVVVDGVAVDVVTAGVVVEVVAVVAEVVVAGAEVVSAVVEVPCSSAAVAT